MRAVYTGTKSMYVYTEQKTGVTIYIYIVAPENLYMFIPRQNLCMFIQNKKRELLYIYI